MARLLDQFGQPVDTRKLLEPEAVPTLAGVRQILQGHPSYGLTPQRLTRLLLEAEDGDPIRYLELAEDMEEKDLHYAGVLGTRKHAVAQLELTMVPAGDDKRDVEIAEAFNQFLERDTIQEELYDILDAVGKGFSCSEIIWEHSASQWMPVRIETRDPRWFNFDRIDGRTLRLLDQGGQLVPLTPFKYIAHLHKAKSGLPIRAGIARMAAWIYLFKNYVIKDWVAFAEVFGQPYRIGKYHGTATPDDKRALLAAVSSIGSDASAIIPESMKIEFIEASRSGSIDLYERFARFCDEQLSKGVLGQTTTTEVTQGGGSRALGEVHDKVKGHLQKSDARQLSATLNAQLVRPFVDLNFGAQKRYPKLSIGLPDELSTVQKIDAITKVVPLGFKVSQRYVGRILGVPQPEGDEDILTPPTKPTPAEDATPPRRETQSEQRPTPDNVDDAVRRAMAESEWMPVIEELTGPLRELLGDVTSLEEARARLAEVVADMDPAKLTELLADTGFAAAIAGQLEDAADV